MICIECKKFFAPLGQENICSPKCKENRKLKRKKVYKNKKLKKDLENPIDKKWLNRNYKGV